jgi:hypothetical protein
VVDKLAYRQGKRDNRSPGEKRVGLRTFQTQKPFEDTAATRNQNAQKAFHDAEGLSQPHNGPVKALR